jgi:hypothetical protein
MDNTISNVKLLCNNIALPTASPQDICIALYLIAFYLFRNACQI